MDDVAVITPYRHQVKLLAHQVVSCGPVEVLTADRSQGRDKECIVVSLVRSNSTNNVRAIFLFRSAVRDEADLKSSHRRATS